DLASTLADGVARAALGAERFRALTLLARARLWARDREGLRTTLGDLAAMGGTGRAATAARNTLNAGLAALDGSPADAAGLYATAAAAWRELMRPLDLALCLIDWHRFAGGDTLDEARGVIERLGAGGLAPLVGNVAAVT